MKFVGNFTNAMAEYCQEKIERLNKYSEFSNLLENAKFKLNKSGNQFKFEIHLGTELRSSAVGDDFYDLVVDVVEKLDGQIRRYRTSKIFNKRYRAPEVIFENPENTEIEILSRKFTICEVLSEDEAIEKMNAMDFDFFIYTDIDEESKTCVVYRRHDGKYGKIVCA